MNIKEIKDGVIMTLLLDEKDNLTLNYTNTKLDFVKNIYFKSNNETLPTYKEKKLIYNETFKLSLYEIKNIIINKNNSLIFERISNNEIKITINDKNTQKVKLKINETFEIQNIKIYHYISSHQQNKEKKNIPPFLF